MISAEKLKVFDPKKFRPGFASPKKNGIHAIIELDKNLAYTRTPSKIQGIGHITESLHRLNICNKHPIVGEVVIPGVDFETASGLLRSSVDCPQAELYIFNCIIPEAKFLDRKRFLDHIKKQAKASTTINVVDFQIVNKLAQFENYFSVQTETLKEEGVCWISPNHVYKPDARGWDWMKWVPFKSMEATVIRALPGTEGKKYENSLGSFSCEYRADGNVYTFDVGIFKGQTDEWRQKVWDNRDSYVGAEITVEYKALSKYNIPTQPRFKCFRWDI